MSEKGFDQQLMLSLFTAESAFDGGVTMNDTNSCSLHQFESIDAEWPDIVTDDKGTVSGEEFGTDQEITEQRVSLPVSIRSSPADVRE